MTKKLKRDVYDLRNSDVRVKLLLRKREVDFNLVLLQHSTLISHSYFAFALRSVFECAICSILEIISYFSNFAFISSSLSLTLSTHDLHLLSSFCSSNDSLILVS